MIVFGPANKWISRFHDRMPMILSLATWLPTVGPGMSGFGQSMIDIGSGAGELKSTCAKRSPVGKHLLDFGWGLSIVRPGRRAVWRSI